MRIFFKKKIRVVRTHKYTPCEIISGHAKTRAPVIRISDE
jgi:hypothetical protein